MSKTVNSYHTLPLNRGATVFSTKAAVIPTYIPKVTTVPPVIEDANRKFDHVEVVEDVPFEKDASTGVFQVSSH